MSNIYESEKYIWNQYIILLKYWLDEKQIKTFKKFLNKNFKTNKFNSNAMNDDIIESFFNKELDMENIKDIHDLKIQSNNYSRYLNTDLFLFDYSKWIEKKYLDLIYDLFNTKWMKIIKSKDESFFLAWQWSLLFTWINI